MLILVLDFSYQPPFDFSSFEPFQTFWDFIKSNGVKQWFEFTGSEVNIYSFEILSSAAAAANDWACLRIKDLVLILASAYYTYNYHFTEIVHYFKASLWFGRIRHVDWPITLGCAR